MKTLQEIENKIKYENIEKVLEEFEDKELLNSLNKNFPNVYSCYTSNKGGYYIFVGIKDHKYYFYRVHLKTIEQYTFAFEGYNKNKQYLVLEYCSPDVDFPNSVLRSNDENSSMFLFLDKDELNKQLYLDLY